MPGLLHSLRRLSLPAISLLGLVACSPGDPSAEQAAAGKQPSQGQRQDQRHAASTPLEESGDTVIFRGICDGSAAVHLGGKTLLVAYDELNTLFAFDHSGGLPTARAELAVLLYLETADEIDIEAATVSGGRIWWLGSHGRDSGGNEAPNRRMLFATNVPSADLGDLQLVTAPQDLTDILLNSVEVAQLLTDSARTRPPKAGGISIEGLAGSAHGGLLLGFRSPLSAADGLSGKALLVSLVPRGDSFEVEHASQLDLGDRGVRDIVNDGSGYLIIAGRVASRGTFALYSWSGDTSPPQQTLHLEDLTAEGLVDLGDHWMVLSDDGKMKRAADDGEQHCGPDTPQQSPRRGPSECVLSRKTDPETHGATRLAESVNPALTGRLIQLGATRIDCMPIP